MGWFSNCVATERRSLREPRSKFAQRRRFDLARAFGGQAEPSADLAQRLRPLAESVMSADNGTLGLVQLIRQIAYVTDLELVEDLLVGVLGGRVDDRVSDRRGRVGVQGQALVDRARRALGCLQALDVRLREPCGSA